MKISKYVTVLLAVVAMAATTVSCDREKDITGAPFESLQKYWINFELTPGSLSTDAQAQFPGIVGLVVYQNKDVKIWDNPIQTNDQSYVLRNFDKAVEAENSSDNGTIRQIMQQTSAAGKGVKDFSVSMVLYSDTIHVGENVEFRNEMRRNTWNAAEMLPSTDE